MNPTIVRRIGPVARFGISEDALHRTPAYTQCQLPRPRPTIFQRATPWWTWVLLLAALPAAVAIVAAPRARADTVEDVAYLATLDVFGVTYPSGPAAISLGHGVCDALSEGIPDGRIAQALMQGGDYDTSAARTIIGAAIGAYCDHYMPASPSSTTGIGRVGGALR